MYNGKLNYLNSIECIILLMKVLYSKKQKIFIFFFNLHIPYLESK